MSATPASVRAGGLRDRQFDRRGRTATKATTGHCRPVPSHGPARHMIPVPLAPLDPRKTRALTTIYAPRKFKPRKNKTAQTRMPDNDIALKPSLLSPFPPLPAIGQKIHKSKTKLIVFDLNDKEVLDPSVPLKSIVKPLTPLKINGYIRNSSVNNLALQKPQQLFRENTYEVLEPVYVTSANVKKNETPIKTVKSNECDAEKNIHEVEVKTSPKTSFKNAALEVVKLSSMGETGKLLCLRERQTYKITQNEEDKILCRFDDMPQTPSQKLNTLTEIFQSLEINGQYRQRLKKENSWF